MKKILVVDGNSIINRAYYGMRPLTTKSGKTTHAVYGMINIISRQLSQIKPDFAAVAFDVKHPTFRHEMYSEYKAGRHATPEDLLSQFPDAKECLQLMGLHVLELPGYEADDIQGTVAKMAHSEPDVESYILSGDRDLLQLIDDKITVLLATTGDTKTVNEAEFTSEYGIRPSQFVEMKALMGDSSDNIPGVAGIGKKGAASLIQNFGTLDGIYENIESPLITKGTREKLKNDKDNAYLSLKLAKINTDAPINLTLNDIKYEGMNKSRLYSKFLELELNSLITKFGLSSESEDSSESSEAPTDNEEVSADVYTPFSLSEWQKSEHGTLSVQILNGKVYICADGENFVFDGPVSKIKDVFYKAKIICHDGKSLWHTLDKAGLDLDGVTFFDLALYAYVLNPGSGVGTPDSCVAAFTGKNLKSGTPCAHFFIETEKKMREKIEEDGLSYILFDIELPLLPILAEIEKRGFKINSESMKEYSRALLSLAEELEGRIYMQAGRSFNINSPKQLGTVLFEEMLLPYPKRKTKTGYSTDAETLEELRAVSPIIDDILEYRQVTKLRGTYAEALPAAADEGGRIHTDFKQALTATGRLSSADPNLQNIPIKTKMGREMRRCFIAEDGYTLVDADYSQIELRLLAHISGDYTMSEAFISGEDIHRKTASAVFGIPEDAVNEEMRKRAKAVNFGIVYGIGGFSLSKDLGITVSEASKYIKSYLMNYPYIDEYLDKVVKEAEKNGYTTTVFGRRRYIPELNMQNGNMRAFGKRVAMNAPIQGTAADIMKIAMINVAKRLKSEELDAKIVMQVHDELVVEARLEDEKKVREILREEMENVTKLSIPLTVDVTSGPNWLEQY
ncbi:MAG: DNA polymerase I [Clostridia bacterium]|nr:DNA polymerase I [Clostridia bacterium]